MCVNGIQLSQYFGAASIGHSTALAVFYPASNDGSALEEFPIDASDLGPRSENDCFSMSRALFACRRRQHDGLSRAFLRAFFSDVKSHVR